MMLMQAARLLLLSWLSCKSDLRSSGNKLMPCSSHIFPRVWLGWYRVENARAVAQNLSKGTAVIESNTSSETNTRVNTNAVVR